MTLIECIPNFSEGRDGTIIKRLRDAISAVNGVILLDISSDPDHNRTVFTFAGEPKSVSEAAFQSISLASQLINLEKHRGVHPRIGASDVVPFVPLNDCTMNDCVEIARELGKRVGESLRIPVYLYEHAAIVPFRRNLADVRRGGYEHLKTVIQHDPDCFPDFGPARLSSAGAVAIGARNPLIAFNAYLSTTNVEIAHLIAREIRESSGGLKAVKALGLLVGGRAQVSMNLVNFKITSMFVVMQKLHMLATKYDVNITDTEIIGLVPQSALIDTALSYLQLPSSSAGYMLEKRIGAENGDYKELQFDIL